MSLRLSIAAPLLLLCGCRAVETSYEYPSDLRHPDYVKRTMAVRDFARKGDVSQLPGAFDLLMDSEPHIRAMAWQAIRGISRGGRDFGYRPYLEEPVRAGIAARWRSWWEAGQVDDGKEASGGG